MAQNIETEATILSVEDDAKWKYSIEADIPAFDGDRSYRYLSWAKTQGPPPQVGAVGRGTFQPYQRSKYWVERGDLEAGKVDGSEKHFHVTWNMVGFVPEAANGAGATQSTSPTANVAVRATSNAPAAPGATYLPAPTADERQAKELAKFRREAEGVNDRKAVSDVLAMVEPGTYVLDGLLEDAEKLAQWYNTRLAARCESPLVQAAQAAGAVVTRVDLDTEPEECGLPPPPSTDTAEVAAIKNRPDLDAYVKGHGWAKADISRVIQDAGFASSAQYLADSSNSVQGLASLLTEHLDSW